MNRGPDGERLGDPTWGPTRPVDLHNFAGNVYGILHEMLVICKRIICQNMPEKKIRS